MGVKRSKGIKTGSLVSWLCLRSQCRVNTEHSVSFFRPEHTGVAGEGDSGTVYRENISWLPLSGVPHHPCGVSRQRSSRWRPSYRCSTQPRGPVREDPCLSEVGIRGTQEWHIVVKDLVWTHFWNFSILSLRSLDFVALPFPPESSTVPSPRSTHLFSVCSHPCDKPVEGISVDSPNGRQTCDLLCHSKGPQWWVVISLFLGGT